MKIINRKARHNYHILESLEAGVVLTGPEVKSLRSGRADLSESFAHIKNGEIILKNCYIFPYMNQSRDYDPRHDRKLLLHKRQIASLSAKISQKATTLVPLSLYEKHNFFKVELALAASKKKFDKRRAIKARDEQRKIEQDLRGIKDNDSRRA